MSDILTDIDHFRKRYDLSPTRFGQLARGDRHLVKQLRNGRRLWPETEDKIRAFMAEYDAPIRPIAPQDAAGQSGHVPKITPKIIPEKPARSKAAHPKAAHPTAACSKPTRPKTGGGQAETRCQGEAP